jgi:hypothetical protein
MEKVTRLKTTPVTLLVLLALLTLLVAKRNKEHPVEEAEEDAVRTVVKLEDTVVHDEYAAVAFVAVIALFALVIWTALGANKGEDTATPPRESSESDISDRRTLADTPGL